MSHVAAAVADLERPIRSAIFSTSSSPIGSTATTRRDRHAALSRRAEAGVHRRVGGEVEIGVGQHDHVVLAPRRAPARAFPPACRCS